MSGYNFQKVWYSFEDLFYLTNSVDPYEMQHYAAFHLGSLLFARALTPLFGNECGRGPWNWENSGVLTKIGKFNIVLMYDISIARLIPIIKLALVYYEKRERKKQLRLYSIIL